MKAKSLMVIVTIASFCAFPTMKTGFAGATMEESAAENTISEVEVSLPDTFHAVVGDTLQLFYRGIVRTLNPYNYNIRVICPKGKAYPRYFEYTPAESDVGEVDFTIEVRDARNRTLDKKTCKLITVSPSKGTDEPTHVLCVGDSLTAGGLWCKEASRRLTGVGGSPAGSELSEVRFAGRFGDEEVGWEGSGGWSWKDFATAGRSAYRLRVSGVETAPTRSASYKFGDIACRVQTVDIRDGDGYIELMAPTDTLPGSGVLEKERGGGDDTLSFSKCEAVPGNPFWNAETDSLDIRSYMDKYGDGRLDAVYFFLSWNGQSAYRSDFSAFITHIRALLDHIHAEYPAAAIKLMGIQVPSLTGGSGHNYGAGTDLADTYGMTVTVFNMNTAYNELANLPEYADFVEFVNISAQFDSENNMPEASLPVNTRSSKMEMRGTNGVHPSGAGQMQIADAVYRNFIANFRK